MADEEYNKKLESLQQYIPFLNNMIVQLKDPRKKNREQQLQKMMSLHSMITDKRKKLKLETLIKCEDVILKLYNKVKTGGGHQGQQPLPQMVPPPVLVQPPPSTPMSPITPSSPSPPREILKTQPVVIPTEKVTSGLPSSVNSFLQAAPSAGNAGSYKPKIDIYSSAADSLKQLNLSKKANVFERLGHDHKRPDMSKPPITIEDLEALQESNTSSPIGDTDSMSLNELTNLREKLQKQLSSKNKDSSINTTVRNSTILTKRAVEKPAEIIKSKVESAVKVIKTDIRVKTGSKADVESKVIAKDTSDLKSAKSVNKVVKSGDIFGSALSSIDNKILEGGSTSNKIGKDRKEERRNSTGSGAGKKDDNSSSSRSNSKEGHSSRDDKHHDKSKSKSHRDDPRISKDSSRDRSLSSNRDHKKDDSLNKDTVKETEKPLDNSNKPKVGEVQTYKRLADKYNPKPRKPSLEAIAGRQPITPSPVRDFETKKPQESPQHHPILSPTSSTNSHETEYTFHGRPREIPSVLTKVMTTPSVNQTKPQQQNYNQSYQGNNESTYPPQGHQSNQRPPSRMYAPFNQTEQQVAPPVTNQFQSGGASRPSTPYGNKSFDRSGRRPDDRDPRRFHDRPTSGPSNSRDPRVMSSRDPRHNRDRSRHEKDRSEDRSGRHHRDPRLNRNHGDNNERPPPSSRDDDTFVSPLDSLYGSNRAHGVLNFRIPKVKKDGDAVKAETKVEPKVEEGGDVKMTVEDSVSSSTEDAEVAVEVKVDGPVATSEITSSTHSDSTAEVVSNVVKDIKNDKESQDIINKFLKDLLQNEQTKAAASLFIDKVSDSVNDERLKMIVEAVKAAKSDTEDKPSDPKEEQEEEEEEEEEVKVEEKPEVKIVKTKPKAKRRRIINRKSLKEPEETPEEVEDEEEEEKVVVSVGERIKRRKRKPVRKQRKQKTELDLLHEDIQDMFIRDGVLTATGKRMCRLLKGDASGTTKTRSATLAAANNSSSSSTSVSPESATVKKRRGRSAKSLSLTSMSASDKNKMNVRDVRVIIPKISVPEMIENASNEMADGEGKRYSLRKHNKEASYNENDSGSDKNDSPSQPEPEEHKEIPVSGPTKATPLTRKTARKRSSAWASGIIKKNKRVAPKVPDRSDDKMLELIEPDKSYYFNQTSVHKFKCKLCDFDGRNITGHYKFQHPDSEVLSSRLSPSRARRAIKESIEQNLDAASDARIVARRILFRCVFCERSLLVPVVNFYDHVTTHTGEYRHKCDDCNYMVCNAKTVMHHCINEHNSRNYHIEPVKTKVFGYLCVECNFVQLDKKAVENHVNIFHLGDGKKVYRINLTTLPYVRFKEKTVEDDEEEEKEEVAAIAKEPSEQASESDHDQSEAETSEKAEEPGPPPLKKIKTEIDMTVFTCNTDMQKENDKIELDRLQKMTELNDSVKTNRQSLNFIDELSNRLMREEDRSPPPRSPEEVMVKEEPLDESDDVEVVPAPVVKKTALPTLASSEPSFGKKRPQKDDTLIRGMIQKLRGILKDDEGKEEEDDDGPPPLSLMTGDRFADESDLKSKVLVGGFLNLYRDGRGLNFACRVPSCLFGTRDTQVFIKHLREDHERVNATTKVTICKICNLAVKDGTGNDFLVTFFKHLMNNHSDYDRNVVANSTMLRVVKEDDRFVYLCRFEFCTFETADREEFLKHADTHQMHVNLYVCSMCDTTVKPADEAQSLMVAYLLHLEEIHLEIASSSLRLRTRRLSGDLLSASNDCEDKPEDVVSQATIEEVDDNPFPFKITGVMSLAEENLPPLSPIVRKILPIRSADPSPIDKTIAPKLLPIRSADTLPVDNVSALMSVQPDKVSKAAPQKKYAQMESVVLKEGKLTAREKAMARKSSQAFRKFMDTPKDLYKCPKFFCKFSTEWRSLFESHIKAHAAVSDEMVCCVYCDIKTPLSQAGLHIDLRHSDCRYSCSLCMYRSICMEYVMVHMKVRHRGAEMIVSLPPKTTKTVMMANTKKWTPKDVCLPYFCGQPSCEERFLFLNDFEYHLNDKHGGVLICGLSQCDFTCLTVGDLTEHWRGRHARFRFNCLLCRSGCMEAYSMLEHYSLTHPNQLPNVVDRSTNSRKCHSGFGYSDMIFEKLKRCTDKDILSSVNPDVFTVVMPTGNVEIVVKTQSEQVAAPFTKSPIVAGSPLQPRPMMSKVEAKPSSSSSVVKGDDDDDGKDDSDTIELCDEIPDNENKNYGLIGYQLFRCAYCDISFSNSADFKNHCVNSKQCQEADGIARHFKCVHCQRTFKNPHGILEHIQYHGQLRFACSLCNRKYPSTFPLKLHMRMKHSVTSTAITPVVANRTNVDHDEFVLRPTPVSSDISGLSDRALDDETNEVFAPDQIHLLPKRHIFTSEVKCSLCSYATKVRTNMQRHLQFHSDEKSVPAIAPVNPVPCLDKNEKMFDKMTNLAISSFAGSSSTGRMGGANQKVTETKGDKERDLPAYVPSHRRYACCVQGCNYLCPEEGNLRHHLLALHATDELRCPHCKCALKSDVDVALKHLKFHELHLYKCQTCDFHHNLRHKVEKHTIDKHPDRSQTVTVVRSLEAEMLNEDPSPSTSSPVKKTSAGGAPSSNGGNEAIRLKVWHCGMCKYRCGEKSEIVSHVLFKHDVAKRFKCTLCSYKTDEKDTLNEHFKTTHPDTETDVIYAYYKKDNSGKSGEGKSFDTTPLWQRDRPRVRHIRGILFEDASTSTPKGGANKLKAQVRTWTNAASPPVASTSLNLDSSIEAVAKGEDDSSKMDDAIFNMINKEIVEFDIAKKSPVNSDNDDNEDDVSDVARVESQDDVVKDDVGDVDDDDKEMSFDDLLEVTKIEETKPTENTLTSVKITPSKEMLTRQSLETKYGKLCSSAGKAFKCPKCSKFRTRKLKYFLYHLLTEMGCDRFRCEVCRFRCVTYDAMAKHCVDRHGTLTPSKISDLPLDESLILWMQLLVHSQSRDLVAYLEGNSVPKPMGTDYQTNVYKSLCRYCNQWFKNTYVLKEHELHHWATVAYACERCQKQFDLLDEFLLHCKECHSNSGYGFKPVGPSITDGLSKLQTPVLPVGTNPTPSTSTCPSDDTSKTSEPLYLCFYCLEGKNTIAELHAHWKEQHEREKVDFMYKEAPAPPAPANAQFYCCTYCHEKGNYVSLKQHHADKHAGLKYSVYQLICIECSATFMHQKEIRSHFGKCHSEKRLTYATIENKAAQGDYPCPKCPFKSVSTGGIRAHLRKHFRPIDCTGCDATFVFASEAKLHYSREHWGSVKIDENKDRLKEYEEFVQKSIAMSKVATPSARKSTGAPHKVKSPAASSVVSGFEEDVAIFVQNCEDGVAGEEDVDLDDDDSAAAFGSVADAASAVDPLGDAGVVGEEDDDIDNLLGRLLLLDEEEELGILSSGGFFDDL